MTATDTAGNTSPANTTTLTVDSIPPATPSCTATPATASGGALVTMTCTGVTSGNTLSIPNMTCTPSPADATGTVTCIGTGASIGADPIATVTKPN